MKLVLSGIQKSFGSKKVLEDISFTFEMGKIYGLLGRNGSGKTTLFNCLSNEIQPDNGIANLVDNNGTSNPLQFSDIGYVLSTPVVPEFLTGYEFIRFFMDIQENHNTISHSIDEWFDIVDFEKEDRHRLIKGYSHGMKNKLQMLACFIASPYVVLLDEPLTSLDVVVALEIKKALQALKANKIILFSTHILQLATDLCDEIVILNNGKLSLLQHDVMQAPDFEEKLVHLLSDEDTP